MPDEKKPEGDDKKLTEDPAFKELAQAVKGITILVQQNATTTKAMQENFTAALDKLGKEPELKHVSLEDQEDDINDLSNIDLLKLVVGEVGKVVDDKIGSVADKLDSTNQTISDTRLTGELKEIMNDNPDFMDWKGEMAAIAKDNPTLSIERIYKLARMESPEKAVELDEKYDESDKEPDKGFLSLMPTGGGFEEADSEDRKTVKEAGDAAWDETVAQFPGLAASGDEG